MTGSFLGRRQAATLLAAIAAAASVAGCGRTLVFAERDGVNIAIRANASSAPPIEANIGLNRTIATIVPPAGEAGNRPDGDAVSMVAGFQIDNTLDPTAPLKADLLITTQFASGNAATAVATKPTVVAAIVNPTAGAKLAAQIDAQTDVIIAAISCDGKTIKPDLLKTLLAASGVSAGVSSTLASLQTVQDFRAAISDAPTTTQALYDAAGKQGRATCPK
jgi:hypothetical protein